jgi:opacity protein-like surface antigen
MLVFPSVFSRMFTKALILLQSPETLGNNSEIKRVPGEITEVKITMRTFLLLALPALLLAGCVSAEDMAAQDDNQCKSYGAAQGSDTYVQCRMWAQSQRQQAQQFDRKLSASTTAKTDTSLTAFCPGFERGYMNGWGSVTTTRLSSNGVPPCPVQPPKSGMQSDFDQGYELGMQLGQNDGRRS